MFRPTKTVSSYQNRTDGPSRWWKRWLEMCRDWRETAHTPILSPLGMSVSAFAFWGIDLNHSLVLHVICFIIFYAYSSIVLQFNATLSVLCTSRKIKTNIHVYYLSKVLLNNFQRKNGFLHKCLHDCSCHPKRNVWKSEWRNAPWRISEGR